MFGTTGTVFTWNYLKWNSGFHISLLAYSPIIWNICRYNLVKKYFPRYSWINKLPSKTHTAELMTLYRGNCTWSKRNNVYILLLTLYFISPEISWQVGGIYQATYFFFLHFFEIPPNHHNHYLQKYFKLTHDY